MISTARSLVIGSSLTISLLLMEKYLPKSELTVRSLYLLRSLGGSRERLWLMRTAMSVMFLLDR